MDQSKIREIFDQFMHYGTYVLAVPYGTGHINDTMQVVCDQGGVMVHYILQRLNHHIFPQPDKLMENIVRVTEHIGRKIKAKGLMGKKRTIELLKAKADGKPYVRDGENWYRAYVFIENARTYDILETAEQAYQAAKAFGAFQCDLADLPAPRLNETIVDFHNTPKRLATLEQAAKEDKCGRLKDVQPEMDFVLARKGEVSRLIDMSAQGLFPERITHNDTKLNNVLIDDLSGNGLAVIDLDTTMPGLVHYDFGDMVRTGTSPAAEDETDLSKVTMRFPMFEALLRGYIESAKGFLTPAEREELPFSGKLITLEIGIRFLTDYLQGDVYFKIHREKHNLDRCRTQFKLVASIEQQFEQMQKLLKSL